MSRIVVGDWGLIRSEEIRAILPQAHGMLISTWSGDAIPCRTLTRDELDLIAEGMADAAEVKPDPSPQCTCVTGCKCDDVAHWCELPQGHAGPHKWRCATTTPPAQATPVASTDPCDPQCPVCKCRKPKRPIAEVLALLNAEREKVLKESFARLDKLAADLWAPAIPDEPWSVPTTLAEVFTHPNTYGKADPPQPAPAKTRGQEVAEKLVYAETNSYDETVALYASAIDAELRRRDEEWSLGLGATAKTPERARQGFEAELSAVRISTREQVRRSIFSQIDAFAGMEMADDVTVKERLAALVAKAKAEQREADAVIAQRYKEAVLQEAGISIRICDISLGKTEAAEHIAGAIRAATQPAPSNKSAT
jgi:hypothetical protein